MLPLAAATSALDKIKSIPSSVWLRLALAIGALILLVVVLRKVAKMNKIVLAIVLALVVSIVGFNWIYERNEPAWATPVIDPLAQFLPTKNALK